MMIQKSEKTAFIKGTSEERIIPMFEYRSSSVSPVDQLTIDYTQFRWIIEVVCKEHLGGMSVGEFARIVFLEKVVDLNVQAHEPEAFRNLQEAKSHHHDDKRHQHEHHHHTAPPKIQETRLWGDIWTSLTGEDATLMRHKPGPRSVTGNTQTSKGSKSSRRVPSHGTSRSSKSSGTSKAADPPYITEDSTLDNTNLIQMRLGIQSIVASANTTTAAIFGETPTETPVSFKKASSKKDTKARLNAQQRLHARVQEYEITRSRQAQVLSKSTGPNTLVRDLANDVPFLELDISAQVFSIGTLPKTTDAAQAGGGGGGAAAAAAGAPVADEAEEFFRDKNIEEKTFDENR
jgi:hypothetical protein